MTNEPEAPELKAALEAHGLKTNKPSQLSDAFRLGWNTRTAIPAKDKLISTLRGVEVTHKASIAELEDQYRLIAMDKINLVAKVAELEAKLAKAVSTFEHMDEYTDETDYYQRLARVTLAELQNTTETKS